MLNTIWFALWGLLWAVYFMLDGFDFGAGILHPFVAKNDTERRMVINTVGPVWDGNEVWLITAGGATFAAFPTTYAYMFSYLYTPLFLILMSLILRGVSFEFRGKIHSESWKKLWDFVIFLFSFLPALLFGVAFGNIFEGLPMDASGYHGTLISLLNPYGLLTGILFVLLFLEHGALWLSIKASDDVAERAKSAASKTWPILLIVAVVFLIYTKFATHLYDNYLKNPVWLVVPAVAVLGLLMIKAWMKNSYVKAFFASCITILGVVFTGIIGLYPSLIPSNIDPKYNLTIFNSSSSPYTLKIMLIVAAVFVPIVIAYQIWAHLLFKKPIEEKDLNDPEVETY
ncbi:cytochrome d ubiquinol oxidase subunit II [Hippea maritima]|uniref:Cytochrome d ubiquinol oxidase, subunit II n=1 Tax=Hippea maritima (strain ATCC 700847 / DSM 10411 / MH2) TaxID=760142 RepID=F2LU52_HIPMA|nr:cytochrome d ubiquinol oxidase subunit II [Hippea maritima]AEA34515.1 cytochrome d ubiquinol oxidase, subunit II [Hippea maritima DSM 10411]